MLPWSEIKVGDTVLVRCTVSEKFDDIKMVRCVNEDDSFSVQQKDVIGHFSSVDEQNESL